MISTQSSRPLTWLGPTSSTIRACRYIDSFAIAKVPMIAPYTSNLLSLDTGTVKSSLLWKPLLRCRDGNRVVTARRAFVLARYVHPFGPTHGPQMAETRAHNLHHAKRS